MTREELNRRRMMFQINAKKNNLLKPEYEVQNPNVLRHSATNDYLEFRKKVAQGAKMQKEARVNLFNVTEANEQYRQELADKTILVHTGAGGMTNAYVAKLDDFYGPGKPRYFYTKEEWEGYQRNKQAASQAGAQRGAKEGADAKNKNLANKAQEAFANANRNSALNTAQSRREEAVNKSKKDLYNKALADAALKGKNGAIVNRMTSLGKAQGGREAAINNSESSVKSSDNENSKTPAIVQQAQSGRENAIKRSDPEYQKELEKAKSIKADKERWGAYSESDLKEISKDKRFSNIKTEDDAVNYPGGVEKLYNDIEAALEKKYPEKKKNYEASKNAGADRAAKEKESAEKDVKKSPKTLADDYTTDNASYKAMVSEVAKAIENGEVIMVGDAPRPVMDSNWKISENGQKAYDAWKKVMNEVNDAAGNTDDYSEFKGQILKNLKKDLSTANEKQAKHSSLEDGITTDAMTPEQEYLNFRTKVEAGLKHFGQTRGLISIPINQALKNGESLSHAGYGANSITNKYYAKIDDFWGKGKPRYFYSKEEWDGYQKNAGYAQNAEKKKAIAQKNSNDSNYQKNADYAKNAGSEKAKKDEWNAASKKTGLSYKEGTNKEWDNMYKKDKQALDEAFWQGKGDLKKAQEAMTKYDFNMESGEGFIDPQEWSGDYQKFNDGKPTFGFDYSLAYADGDLSNPKVKEKFIKDNQPIIDHCVEFYEKYCLENSRLTEDEVRKEIKKYLGNNRVGYKGESVAVKDIPGYVDTLYNDIEDRLKSEKKAWDRTHK